MCLCAIVAGVAGTALGNVGPFVLKYPEGDATAEGALARIDPNLMPARETRLRVVEEKLTVSFCRGFRAIVFLSGGGHEDQVNAPVDIHVEYTIENPTDEAITLDLGFPILRGLESSVTDLGFSLSNAETSMELESSRISHVAIYGIIRQRARQVIETGIASSPDLARLVAAVRESGSAGDRDSLTTHLTRTMKWSERDAALLVEYAVLDLGPESKTLPLRAPGDVLDWDALKKVTLANLGALRAIGEQRATQFFAQLASRFDPDAAASYEAIFEAWGGSVRERAVDLRTGAVRPRQVVIDRKLFEKPKGSHPTEEELTLYLRVDKYEEKEPVSPRAEATCKRILKNLPVVFTFAPMGLVHCRAQFRPRTRHTLSIRYGQQAYVDTKGTRTYQVSYISQPANLWDSFGPMHVEFRTPYGVQGRASVPLDDPTVEKAHPKGERYVATYCTTLEGTKPRELIFAVDADAWETWWKGDLVPPPLPLSTRYASLWPVLPAIGLAFLVIAAMRLHRVRKRTTR
jgi:hypothetical protein